MEIAEALLGHDTALQWGYLFFAASMLGFARRARNKHVPRDNMLSFFLGLLPSEYVHCFLALNGVVAYALHNAQRSVLSGWVGAIAGVMQCVAVARLADIFHANISAKHAIREIMAASGAALHSVNRIGTINLKLWLGIVLMIPPTAVLKWAFPGISMVETVVFARVGKNKTTDLRLDVYKHRDTPPNAPILLFIHGGGWVVGARNMAPFPIFFEAAARGWVVCSIDYRLSPRVAFPGHLIDVKRAIAYLRRNARERFDANPDFIVVSGGSAGGHLGSLVALTAEDKSFQPGFEDADTSVSGCIDCYGVHDFKDRHGVFYYKDGDHSFVRFLELLVMQKSRSGSDKAYDKASPISWLDEDKTARRTRVLPPFLVAHGALDTIVPCEDSRLFYEKLQMYRQRTHGLGFVGVPDVHLEIPDAHHAFDHTFSPRVIAFSQAVGVFLDNLYEKAQGIPVKLLVVTKPRLA